MKQSMLRIAHLSDLHFSHISYSWKQLLSKQWLGNANVILHRKRIYQPERLQQLGTWLKTLQVKHVIVTGDLVTTASAVEFERACAFLLELQTQGMHLYLVPGNHDKYTKQAEKEGLFEKYFAPFQAPLIRKTNTGQTLAAAELNQTWWWIGLDTTLSTPLFASWGLFTEEAETLLDALLQELQGKRIILSSHYPLFATEGARRSLKRAEALQKLLKKHAHVKIYLHGHTHQRKIIDLQKENLPIVIDGGSCSHIQKSSVYLLTLEQQQCHIQLHRPNLFFDHSQWPYDALMTVPLR